MGMNGRCPALFRALRWPSGNRARSCDAGSRRAPAHSVFRVGELHGKITPRVEELAELLGSVDGAYATSNIWGERWSKLTLNAASNPVVAMTGLGAQGMAADPRARLVYIQIAKECVQVGQALDYQIEPVNGIEAEVWSRADQGDAFEELDARLLTRGDPEDWRSSMAQDVTKGRKSEIEQMNGYIVEKGRERNVATPVNEAVVRLMKEIEARGKPWTRLKRRGCSPQPVYSLMENGPILNFSNGALAVPAPSCAAGHHAGLQVERSQGGGGFLADGGGTGSDFLWRGRRSTFHIQRQGDSASASLFCPSSGLPCSCTTS